MARQTKEEKRIKGEVDRLFKLHGTGVQFNIMDLGKIDKAAKAVLAVGGAIEDAEAAMLQAISQYRVN